MRLWTEDSLPRDLVRPEVYERLRNPAERSDIIRLEVVFRSVASTSTPTWSASPDRPSPRRGGAIDFFVAGARGVKGGRAHNAVIAAVSGHPVLERALRKLRPVTEFGIDKRGTGPDF